MRLRDSQPVVRLLQASVGWRGSRLFCAVWFTLTSLGFPLDLFNVRSTSCAVNPGQGCRCSMAKRMSGTCCCRNEAVPVAEQSCCSIKKSSSSVPQAQAECCGSKKNPSVVSTKSSEVELAVAACDCSSDVPGGSSLEQQPRLLAAPVVLSELVVAVVVCKSGDKQAESASLAPPIPPPKIVVIEWSAA